MDRWNYDRNRDRTSYSEGNTGPIQGAHGTRNPPSGDPDTCIASHSVAYQPQDARSSLQSMSGLPDGSEGRCVETFPSASNAHVTDAPQVPTTALDPQQPLESFPPMQPVDMLSTTNEQPTELESTAVAFTQQINTAAAT